VGRISGVRRWEITISHAFQKATQELNKTEQDILAKFLLQNNLHLFIQNNIRFINEYNADTQQAIQEVAERTNLNYYAPSDALFAKLDL